MTGPDETIDGMTDDDILAIDLAIGALPREARRAAELRLRSDRAFRTLVEDWQTQLAPLDAATPAAAPPVDMWQAIAAEIAPPAHAAPRPVAAAAPQAAAGWWNSLAVWRGLALAGTAAAVIAVAMISAPPPTPGAPPQLLVAALAGADGKPLLSAAYDPLRGEVVLTPATQRDDVGKSPELWVIEGDNPPRSLGVIDIRGPSAVVIPPQRLRGLEPGSTLAISIEPLGGSPTGQPTGPIVATGKLTAI